MTYQNVGSLLAYLFSALLHSSEHGVAGYGTIAVGETTDTDILGHLESHALGSVHNTYGCIVVDGKESIRAIFRHQQIGGDGFCIGTIVADTGDALIVNKPMLQQGILISVETIL